MKSKQNIPRRVFLVAAAAAGGGACLSGCASAGNQSEEGKLQEDEVSPAEDLMREHGVLKRVLLVYREALRCLAASQPLPPEPVADGAHIIRDFIEEYHEKLEEDYLFPRFRRAGKLVELVDILTRQHQAGRQLTDLTLRFATAQAFKDPPQRAQFVQSLEKFIRMYEPHEAREDTVLFPAFRGIVSPHEYDALGEDFEKKEHQLFGEEGFEKMLDRVANIEKELGIYDLAQFTPKL